mmetsp:Transcript_19611/g.37982  ORF Transcript_19611/g.37982 Transcript_19611/m.37982 type:complete len:97 (+) Transcript_19611:53-343(+)|eukprot:CAMPEP_0167803074 /NCGR_PEP_ID=MMETSP0111_2-20121227/19555_1 /TAXON_ID=91324 /ORGANISM="Lotharella globosa, Strain CCCM811" /LENGTH=96 /DNA_ID=CAMNT_0007699345 /DNA_START=30 /DNA_END=320 /DNA_ORIENTATION=+
MSSSGLVHNEKDRQFELHSGKDGVVAYVMYSIDKKASTIDLEHTFTDENHRGKGNAAKVVRAAFQYAKENNLKVIPSCTYIPVFVKKNPEWKDRVV